MIGIKALPPADELIKIFMIKIPPNHETLCLKLYLLY